MNTDEFFAEAKRLNLRMLGTPEETRAALDAKDAEIETLRSQLEHWKAFAIHAEGEHAAWKKTATELDAELRALKAAAVDGRTYTQADLLEAVKTERYACSIAVWMTLQDALAEGADDKGLDGWMREAEQRIKNRSLNDPDLRAISRPSTPDGWSDTDWIAHLRREAACPAYAKGPLPETGWD